MQGTPTLAATLPMPALPQPIRPEHFALRLMEAEQRIEIACWCGTREELDTYDAWTGRCIERFCHKHAQCQHGKNVQYRPGILDTAPPTKRPANIMEACQALMPSLAGS